MAVFWTQPLSDVAANCAAGGRRAALTVASQGGHLRVVEVLIAAGADVAAKTGFG
jgi:hypothetical protein